MKSSIAIKYSIAKHYHQNNLKKKSNIYLKNIFSSENFLSRPLEYKEYAFINMYCTLHWKKYIFYFSGNEGLLKWTGEWVVFLDTMLQFTILGKNQRALYLPTRIQSLTIDPLVHSKVLEECLNEYDGMHYFFSILLFLLVNLFSLLCSSNVSILHSFVHSSKTGFL